MTRTELTTDERLALLAELERKETARLRRAGWAAWTSVVLAVAVMGTLLGVGSWRLSVLRSETHTARAELTRLGEERAALGKEKETLERDLQAKRAESAALSVALGSVDPKQSREAVEKALTRDPKAAASLPRIYLQIIDPNDRAWAGDMGKALQSAGFLVLGVEYVPKARPQKHSEVRFYKRGDEKVAERIVDALRQAGVDVVPPKYLGLEDNPAFRPNHFEVWFAPKAS